MLLHKNARLTPITRKELVRSVVQDFVPLSAAAADFNVSPKTAAKWVHRFQREGCQGLLDRSSRPHRIPRQLSSERTDEVQGFAGIDTPSTAIGFRNKSLILEDHRSAPSGQSA